MIFTEYKYLFGKPREGFHELRLLDAAFMDYIGTIVLAMLFSYVTKIPLVLSTIFMFIFGELCHYLVGLETNSIKYLGLL